MNNMYFSTGNDRKFAEAERVLRARLPHLTLRRLDIDAPELQTDDPSVLLADKIAQARKRIAFPVLVDDVSCEVDGTDGFPGALVKHVLRSLGPDGVRRAFPEGAGITVRSHIALAIGDETVSFVGEVRGVVRHGRTMVGSGAAATDNVPARNGTTLDEIVELPEQGCFLGDEGADTHRSRALDALCAWIAESDAADEREMREIAERWSGRAEAWSDTIADSASYVNHEDGYARFDALALRMLAMLGATPNSDPSATQGGPAPTCIDVGCGTGEVTRLLAGNGAASVLGTDISDGMITQARAASEDVATAAFRVVMPEELVRLGTFDLIVSRGVVLSHLPTRKVMDHLAALTALAHEGSYLVLDFIQHLENGGFPNAGTKNTFDADTVFRSMRELGWVPVALDGAANARVAIAAFHRPFPDSLYFVTGNAQKVRELAHAAGLPHLHGCDFDLPELKHDDIRTIAEDKARQAHAIVRRPVVCTDGGIFLHALGGFPGPNSKHAARKLGPAGLVKLLDGVADRTGARINAVSWTDGANMRTTAHEVPIRLADGLRGDYPAYPLDKVLIPDSPDNVGSRTYAEMPVEERVAFTELPELARFVREVAGR